MKYNSILVIDDSKINRTVLKSILEYKYNIIECSDGKEALECLKQNKDKITLILLDLVMPVMDGFEFMDIVCNDRELRRIPIIVETASDDINTEIRCLGLGASDFISKPFHKELVKHRVSSIIRLRDSSAMINLLEFDKLTGFYSKEFFFKYSKQIIENNKDCTIDIVCCNIENFKYINETFGVSKGDETLTYLSNTFRKNFKHILIYGYLGNDKLFCLANHYDQFNRKMFIDLIEEINVNSPVANLNVKFAIYEDIDKKLPIENICDRALSSLERIKGVYGQVFVKYDDELRQTLLKEQEILNTMDEALINGEFIVYYQPKHNIMTNEITGLEALVRWQKKDGNILMPDSFITLFEKNGFITKLDFYVWEEVVKLLCKWRNEGKELIPISVNVSRIDFSHKELINVLCQLVERYDLEPKLLHLEVTETAYTELHDEIISKVGELRIRGFKIEMDDFGRGYSSLSMLSELPIDILKIDMSFIQKKYSMEKKSILNFIFVLAKWLDIETIAEGVETEEQEKRLRFMGCNQVQGYYYSMPLPVVELEKYICKSVIKDNTTFIDANRNINDIRVSKTILVGDSDEKRVYELKEILDNSYRLLVICDKNEYIEYVKDKFRTIGLILLDVEFWYQIKEEMNDLNDSNISLSDIPTIVSMDEGESKIKEVLEYDILTILFRPFQQEFVLHSVRNAFVTHKLKRAKDALEHQQSLLEEIAYRDSMTKILNRRGLYESVKHLSANSSYGIYMMDIDNLKRCNDEYGHEYGDLIIKLVCNAIKSEIRKGDIFARIGGDEFVIIIDRIDDLDIILEKGNHIANTIKKYDNCLLLINLSCSLGATIMPPNEDFNKALQVADKALYTTKKSGKGFCSVLAIPENNLK